MRTDCRRSRCDRSCWRRSAPGPPTSWSGGSKGYYARGGRGARGGGRCLRAARPASGSRSSSYPWPTSCPRSGGARGRASRRTSSSASTSAPILREWAYEGRLVDLSDAVGPFADLFDKDALDRATLLDGTTGQRALYALPMGRTTMSTSGEPARARRLHARRHPEGMGAVLVLLVRQGPAGGAQGAGPRRRLGHRPADVGRGRRHARPVLPVRGAYEADYVTRDGRLVIDDPRSGSRLVKALDGYTASTARAAPRPTR